MANKKKLSLNLKDFPDNPGVYLMKDSAGKIVYIGKATSLKKRVASYFTKQHISIKQEVMLEKVANIEYILTRNEVEALILESALIKKNKPKYNVSLKDDKNYPLIKVTKNEDFPRLIIARRKINNRAAYFGPYTNAKLLRSALKTLRMVFPYRSCQRLRKSACLDYDLGLCPAPCVGKITKKEYKENIDNLYLFLEGKNALLLKQISKRMSVYAKKRNFEKAKQMRDKISALSSILGARPFSLGNLEAEELKNILHIKKDIERIEAFDISSISGNIVVGAMVSFLKGRPDKTNYRKFKIKSEKLDDCASIAEIIRRRYRRVVSKEVPAPDLIIIDGGKGQLNSAKRELAALRLRIPVISIAKKEEQIYKPNQTAPLKLKIDSMALTLVRRIRDEAHRFAISYHRLLRKKKTIK